MHRIPTFACTIGIPRIAEVTRHRMRCSSFVGKAERQWARDIDGLSRGYVSKSRHGAPQFQDPRLAGFYSTELSMQSYSQWCEQHRPLAKAGD
jgi:hypothetical protein